MSKQQIIELEQQTVEQLTIDACLRLGDRLVTPKVADCSPLQTFYSRDKKFTLQLKEQENGRQFLRLAIALVASIGMKRAAAVLAKVLEDQEGSRGCDISSSCLDELLPTTEFRAKAQFRSSVSDYYGAPCNSEVLTDTCPDEDSLVPLINAICKVVKSGGEVKIFAASCWPWVMALLEWLLGPPLDAVSGKQRFRCRVSIVLAKRASPKTLHVAYRKRRYTTLES